MLVREKRGREVAEMEITEVQTRGREKEEKRGHRADLSGGLFIIFVLYPRITLSGGTHLTTCKIPKLKKNQQTSQCSRLFPGILCQPSGLLPVNLPSSPETSVLQEVELEQHRMTSLCGWLFIKEMLKTPMSF